MAGVNAALCKINEVTQIPYVSYVYIRKESSNPFRCTAIVSIRRMWFGTIFDPVDEHDVSFLLTPTKVI